jgi:membrane protein DedA with SNARE-associated domain
MFWCLALNWVDVLANAVSMAVGVSVGSIIAYYITQRQVRKVWRSVERSELYKNASKVMAKLVEVVESKEFADFVKGVKVFLTAGAHVQVEKKPLIELPKKPEARQDEAA